MRPFVLLASGAALIFAAAFALSGYVFVSAHAQSDRSRRETRDAAVLLGRALCGQSAVFEGIARKNAKSPAARARVVRIFTAYNKPVDIALRKLDAKPCKGKG